jgi:subtilisin family serine protease
MGVFCVSPLRVRGLSSLHRARFDVKWFCYTPYSASKEATEGIPQVSAKRGGRELIDSCASLRRFTDIASRDDTTPLLRWTERWRSAGGRGVLIGILDTGCDSQLPDLVGADLVIRDFTGGREFGVETREHGTHSVTLLLGQGRDQIRGLVPYASVLLSTVVGTDGLAKPLEVVHAIDWLITSGAQVVVLPLGDTAEHSEISRLIERGIDRHVLFFAAAGNNHPDPLMFPARHPYTIAVGAAGPRGTLLPECCRIPRLDLVAPGWKIAAPVRPGIIRRRSGSSVACVVAAGVAALMLSSCAVGPTSIDRGSLLASLGGVGGSV